MYNFGDKNIIASQNQIEKKMIEYSKKKLSLLEVRSFKGKSNFFHWEKWKNPPTEIWKYDDKNETIYLSRA